MPLETATYIGDLVITNPSSSDSGQQGDDHLRLIKKTLKNTFPNLNGPVTRTPYEMNFPVPIGTIVLWYSTLAYIPNGWALCDGSTVARSDGAGSITLPDLRGLFVMGASINVQVGTSAGANEKSTSSGGLHSHGDATGTSGNHSHNATTNVVASHTHTASTSTGGGHTHSASTASAGSHNHAGATGLGGAHNHGGATGFTTLTLAQLPSHHHKVVHDDSVAGPGDPTSTTAVAQKAEIGNNRDYNLQRASAGTYANVGRSSLEGGNEGHNHFISTQAAHTHPIGNSGAHTHEITVSEAGAHNHSVTVSSGGSHSHTVSVSENGSHSHTITPGGTHSHMVDVTPAHRKLYYIMKV